jgi:hypothetical protein
MGETWLNQIKKRHFRQNIFYLLNRSADHSTLLQRDEAHGSQLQQSVCLSQCNVTQIENLLACRISCSRFSGCKSREQTNSSQRNLPPPCAAFRSADFKANSTTQSSSFRLYPPFSLSLTPVHSLFLQHFTTFITHCGGSSPSCSVHRNCQDFAWL